MAEAPPSRFAPLFVVYTALGYLALALHGGVFATDPGVAPTRFRTMLVVANLLAGSWCFLRALMATRLIGGRAEPR
jgi:hypothetical protein